MKKVLSLVLSLVMLLSMVVPVSAEDTYPGNGTLKDKTAAFTIEADKTTLYGEGEQIVRFHIYVESKDSVPIRAFQFTLVPSEGLTLADKEMAKDGAFYYALQNNLSTNGNVDGMYSLLAYTPGSRYFGAAGTDEGKGITKKTEIMTIMGKVNGVGDYTLSMSGVVAGNGDAPNNIAEKFTSTVAGATVTVKPEGEQPQPNLSLALSTDKVKVGDTFTATLSNKGMTVSSFIAQLKFDKEMLAVTKIEQLGGFAKLAAGATIDPVLSTPDEANDRSLVGVGFVRGSDKTHEAGEFLRVTFQAKAAGNTAISLYEDSDGTNGYRGDISGGTVTVEKAGEQNPLVMRVVPQSNTVCPKAANATVKFDVVIEKNPGVAAAQFTVGYDKSKLVLVGVTKADGMLGTLTVEGDKFLWDYSEDLTETGNFLQLTFTAKTGATMGNTSATLIHVDVGDVSNYDEEDVATQIYSGEVTFAHTYEEYVPTSEDIPATPATCTTKATYCKRCICGEESTETFEYGELTGHDFRTVSVVPATNAAAGVVTSICSRCDETKTEEFAFADAAVRLTVGTADGTAKIHRGTIDVPVAIAVDKGMDSAEFAVAYDKTRLVLTGVSTGWILDGDTVKTATKLTGSTKVVLTFAVKTDADNFVNPGDAVVSISDAKVYSGEEIMTIGAISGKVVVTKAGDINGDGKINSKDVTRLRKIVLGAEKDVLGAANINGDAKVNSKDVTRLRKCVLGVTSEVYY